MPNQNGDAGAERPDQRQRLAQAHQRVDGGVGRGHRHVHVQAHSGVRLISPRISPSTRR